MVREDLGHHHGQVHRGVTEHGIGNARRQHLLVQACPAQEMIAERRQCKSASSKD